MLSGAVIFLRLVKKCAPCYMFYRAQSLIIFVVFVDTPNVDFFQALTRYVTSDLSLYTWDGVAFLCGRIFESNQDRPVTL